MLVTAGQLCCCMNRGMATKILETVCSRAGHVGHMTYAGHMTHGDHMTHGGM